MTRGVFLEGFDRDSGDRVLALWRPLRRFAGYPLSRRPRELTAKEVDAIIRRFPARRLKGFRYTIRRAERPTTKVWERSYEVAGFVPWLESAFFGYVDDEHVLTFDDVRKATRWRRSEEEFVAGVKPLSPAGAKAILEKLGFKPVDGASYDIGVVMHYPPAGPSKTFVIEVRPRGRKHFRNYLTLGLEKLPLWKVDAILGTSKRGRREIVDITAQQVDELCFDFGYREDVKPSSEYRISRKRNGERIPW